MNLKNNKVLIPLFIVSLGIVIFLLNRNVGVSDETLCTRDVFQCPNGSYVSREGKECTFKACPNEASFVGVLRQDQNGFALIFGAPEGGPEVAYVMPLKIKISNVLGQFIGKRVRVYGTFTEGATLAVKRLEGLPGDFSNPELGRAGIGESVFVNGVLITLHEVISDSRCPIDVVCIQAGNVLMRVTLKSNTDREVVKLTSDGAPIPFDSYQVSVKEVNPSILASIPINPKNYLVTFKVTENPKP